MLLAFGLAVFEVNAKGGPVPQEHLQGPSVEPVTSLSFDFVQTKTSAMLTEKVVATGCMSYTAPDKVRWEYKTPTQTVFDSTAGGRNRSFKNFSSLISTLVGGGSFKSDDNFNVSIEETTDSWKVTMKPVRKDLKQMFSSLRLTLSKPDSIVRIIEIEERGGDTTVIECSNIKSER